jgi:hypothetical protein
MSHNLARVPAGIYLMLFELKNQSSGGQPEITQQKGKDRKLETMGHNSESRSRHRESLKVKIHAFLTLAQDGYEWSVSSSGYFTSKERTARSHKIGVWVGL